MMTPNAGNGNHWAWVFCGVLWLTTFTRAEEFQPITAKALQSLDARVLKEPTSDLENTLAEDSRARLRAANQRESEAWRKISSRDEWEAYRDERIAALRRSLGEFPPVPQPLPVRITGELNGEGYRIEKLVFESRPGLWVTANLYQPAKLIESMPGLLICHSHHNPKTQSELQDMGMMWAKTGCLVLVMDQLGHGERRQHPFRTEADYAGSFRPSRQDYYFRYNVALQLHLVGESLIGWMAWDLMRGVDLLLSRPGVDPKRILLLGAVAGGGDPAAVTAAIDPRITGVVPFNFGGPQPETRYPLPEDAEDSFNYAGSGSWESTRNLRLSARDGFLPWVIVGSLAPRALIYAHEFRWDQERDPVWKRFNTIYGFYNARDHLSFVTGFGSVRLGSAEASHCNNVGPTHRRGIHPAFEKWFQIKRPDEEFRDRHPEQELHCLTGEQASAIKLTPVYKLADQLAEQRLAQVRQQLKTVSPANRREQLQSSWRKVLGDVEPYQFQITQQNAATQGTVRVERLVMTGEREIRVPMLLLIPEKSTGKKQPVVVALAHSGKAGFLEHRSEMLAALLAQGVAVCLPDLRGTGETRPGDGRSRPSWSTSLSASELMLGQTLPGSRLKDLRSLLEYLRTRAEFDPRRIAVWGDSTAKINPPDRNLRLPWGIDEEPELAEPGGPLLALLAGLYDDQLAAVVVARGGLVSWRSLLESPFLYVPHDAIIPGALTAGDVPDLAAYTPRPLWISGMVDGQNRLVGERAVARFALAACPSYNNLKWELWFQLHAGEKDPARAIVPWLLEHLRSSR